MDPFEKYDMIFTLYGGSTGVSASFTRETTLYGVDRDLVLRRCGVRGCVHGWTHVSDAGRPLRWVS